MTEPAICQKLLRGFVMSRIIILIIGCLALLPGTAQSQEVVISGFPVGVGGSVAKDFFVPYFPRLQAIADSLDKYPLAQAIVTGGADGERYRRNSDAMNPALALGRAHSLRNLLIYEFNVDSLRIEIRTRDFGEKGPSYRFASVRIAWVLDKMEERIDIVEKRPPVEKHFTELKEITTVPMEYFGLQLSIGITSSPFGGIPIVASAMTWKNIVYVEGIVGHTFWNNSFRFQGVDLNTKRRIVGGQVTVFPFKEMPVGIVGGWVRIEEISRKYYDYVKLSEGLVVGLRGMPYEFLSVVAAYNPSKHRVAGDKKSRTDNDQFMVSIMVHKLFGGGK